MFFQLAEFGFHDFVVVASPGVAGDFSGVDLGIVGGWLFLKISEADADDAFGPGEFFGDVDAFFHAIFEIGHRAVFSGGDPVAVGVAVGGGLRALCRRGRIPPRW